MAGLRKKCLVPGCQTDVAVHPYTRKRGACAVHMHAHSVQLYGMAHRFCQQCGRFQPLTEFVRNYRSCELSVRMHNQRRRERYLKTKLMKAPQQGVPGAAALLPEPDSSDEDSDNSDTGCNDNAVPPAAAGAAQEAPIAPQAPPAAAVEPQHPVPAGTAYNGVTAQPASAAVEQQNPFPVGAGAVYNNGMAAEANMHAGPPYAGALPAYNPPGAQVPAAGYYAVQQPVVRQPQLVQPQHLLSHQQQQLLQQQQVYELQQPAMAMPAPTAHRAFGSAARPAVMEPPAVMYGGVAHNSVPAGYQHWQHVPYAPAGAFMPPAQCFAVQQQLLQPGHVSMAYDGQVGFSAGGMREGRLLAGHPGPKHSMGGGLRSPQGSSVVYAAQQGVMQQALFYGQATAVTAGTGSGLGSGLVGTYHQGSGAHHQLAHPASAPPQSAGLAGGQGRADLCSAGGMWAFAGAGAGQPLGQLRQPALQQRRRQPGPASTVPNAPGFWQVSGEAQLGVEGMGTVGEGRLRWGAEAPSSLPVGLSAGTQASNYGLHAESAAAAGSAGALAGAQTRAYVPPASCSSGAGLAGTPAAVSCFASAAQQVPVCDNKSGPQDAPGVAHLSHADSAVLAFLESIDADPAALHGDGGSQTGLAQAGSNLSQELGSLLDDALMYDGFDGEGVSGGSGDEGCGLGI